MKKTTLIILLLFVCAFITFLSSKAFYKDNENRINYKHGPEVNNINDIIVKDMDGKSVPLKQYNGKVLLIVNVASKCGFTPQYKALEELYKKYKSKGFEILAFPCNDFGGQEPGTNEEIKNFCTTNYNITFKLFDKITILGDNKSPLYERLTNNPVTEKSPIGWNFEKFLIDKKGNIIARFKSKIDPMNNMIVTAVERELNKKVKRE